MRENELLRLHKPFFNVLNTRSEHYPFIGVRALDGELTLRLTKSGQPLRGEQLFGAFKGLPLVRSAFAALARLLWLAEHPSCRVFDLPLPLLRKIESWPVPAAQKWKLLLLEFLAGQSGRLIETLGTDPPNNVSPFEQTFRAHDLELLREFFVRGPQRNYQLRQLFNVAEPCIAQSEVDDLLVLREQYAKPIAPRESVS